MDSIRYKRLKYVILQLPASVVARADILCVNAAKPFHIFTALWLFYGVEQAQQLYMMMLVVHCVGLGILFIVHSLCYAQCSTAVQLGDVLSRTLSIKN